MPLDTLKVAKQMEAAGMPRSQSEALAAVLNEEFVGQVVTNSDLGVAVDRLETRIEAAEERLNAKIEAVEERLNGKIEAVEERLNARIAAVDAKIDATSARHDARLQMMQWMMGLNFAATLGILWKLLR